MKNIKYIFWVFVVVVVLYFCVFVDGNYLGIEYMFDMGYFIVQEVNVFIDYYYNIWDSVSVVKFKELFIVGLFVKGVVFCGYVGVYLVVNQEGGFFMDVVMVYMNGKDYVQGIVVFVNGFVFYYYEDIEFECECVIVEIIDNFFFIIVEGLVKGEDFYNKFCGICYGEKGDGVGYLVFDENFNVVYLVVFVNFLLDQFLEVFNGCYYYVIMYGKNVMGGYVDKIFYEECWQVIYWICVL